MTNRRASLRRRIKGSTKVVCRKGMLGLGPNLTLSVIDISETGVQLTIKVPLDKKQDVEVTLEGMAGRPVKALATVVWATSTADGSHLVGLKFDKPLRYHDLSLLSSGS